MKNIWLGLVLLVAFASCKKENKECPSSEERAVPFADFTKISAGESFNVNIRQGTLFVVSAKGCTEDLNDVQMAVENGTLVIKYGRFRDNRFRMDLDIQMPTLAGLQLDGAARATVTGFSLQPGAAKFKLDGSSYCNLEGLPELVDAEISGTSVLNLQGLSSDLIAHLSGDARLTAYAATFNDADVYTSGTAKAQVQVTRSLFAQASGDSRIYYKGNPPSVNAEQYSTAKVIHE